MEENYFTLFGLPIAFTLSEAELHKRYIALQQQYHPDKMVGKSDIERHQSVTLSMRINDGYETLKSPLDRAQYLLLLEGIVVNDEDDNVKPDSMLLMEMMEMREQLEYAQDGMALKAAMDDIKKAMSHCLTDMEAAFVLRNYEHAAPLTMRLKYLGKALEDAHARIYALRAAHEASSQSHH